MEFESLTLFHDPALRLLYHRWRGEHNMHLFRPAVEHIQRLLQHYDIEYWVIDLAGLPNVSLEDQVWFNNHILPRVASSSLEQLAVVLSCNMYNQMAAESIFSMGQLFLPFDIQFFGEAETAMEWLINPTTERALPIGVKVA